MLCGGAVQNLLLGDLGGIAAVGVGALSLAADQSGVCLVAAFAVGVGRKVARGAGQLLLGSLGLY